MKKFIVAIAMCIPCIAFAQPGKGTVLLSGNVAFSKSENQDIPPFNTVSTDFSVYAGMFVSPRVALGIMGNYSRVNSKQDSPNNGRSITTQSRYGAAPFVRYYHPITERFYFFAEGSAGYSGDSRKYTNSDAIYPPSESKSNGLKISVRPGISYFIAKRWAVELLMGAATYTNMKYTSDGQSNSADSFSFNFLTRGIAPSVLFTF